MPSLDDKITRLRDLLAGLDRVVVCFSGGVDSGYLLAEAVGTLGDRATALTAVSPSLVPEEGADAKRLAEQLGARHVLVDTYELDDARYAANPVNRCYFCKTEVYGRAVTEAGRLGTTHVLDGFNVDDCGDHRPGRHAAREQGVRFSAGRAGLHQDGHPRGRAASRSSGLEQTGACLSLQPVPVWHGDHAGTAHPRRDLRARAPRSRISCVPGPLSRHDGPDRGRARGDPQAPDARGARHGAPPVSRRRV